MSNKGDVEIPSIPIAASLDLPTRCSRSQSSSLVCCSEIWDWRTGLVGAPFHKSFLKTLLAEMIQSYSASNLSVSPLAVAETGPAGSYW